MSDHSDGTREPVREVDTGNAPGEGRPGPPGDTPEMGPPPGAAPPPSRRSVLALAGPMTLAEVVDLLVVVGVVALMGRMGDEALYVRSLYMPIGFLFIAVFTAFEIANQVSAAVSRGRGRPQDVLAMASSLLRIWAVVAVVLFASLILAGPFFADVLDVAPESRPDFQSFLFWMSLAELSHIAPVLCSSSLRGYGRARAAAVVTLTDAAVHFGIVAVLGLGAGMGVLSVPLAGVLSSAVGLALGLFFLRRTGLWVPRTPRPWQPSAFSQLGRVGVPVAGTHVVLFGANMGLLWVLSPFGPEVVSGYSTAATLQGLIIMPGIMFGSATAIVMNQQMGSGRFDVLGRTLRSGLELVLGIYLAVALAVWLGGDLLAQLMTPSPEIAAQTAHYLHIVGLTYLLQGLVLASLTILEQTGAGPLAVTLNVIYYAAIIAVGALVTAAVQEPTALYRVVAFSNLLGVSVLALAIFYVRRLQRSGSPLMASGSPS
ncbi:MATE family efflux transporter [Marinactinospora rubrisoli]|uniref:MATE family efflux transporter n=1 Tax=Marinactinospora rubrisoli TaxID=2715399 RepID=A0ABW2KF37_9ACTN